MIKIAICDDEATALLHTKNLLYKYTKDRIEIDSYNSGKELAETPVTYDIIILDIDMDGINGIETAKRIREKDKKVKIIYLTSYTEYTIYAFAVHAFAYLVKPVNEEDLYKQLDEAFMYREIESDDVLEMQSTQGLIHQKLKDIYYCEYQSRYMEVHTKEVKFRIKTKITDLMEKLKPYHFEMPHKSFIVNLYYVKNIKGYNIILTDGSEIPLSQKKSAEFRKELNTYLSSCIENR